MGVMSKLIESADSQNLATRKSSGTRIGQRKPAAGGPTFSSPSPCQSCGCPGFWIDVYQGGPHCRGCSPPSVPSLVDRTIWVVGRGPGEYRWVRRLNDPDHGEILGDANGLAVIRTVDAWQMFEIERDGRTVVVHALRGRVDQARVAGSSGRYHPPLVDFTAGAIPVGDMTIDEWLDRVTFPWPATIMAVEIQVAPRAHGGLAGGVSQTGLHTSLEGMGP